jgi:hypothetical protein
MLQRIPGGIAMKASNLVTDAIQGVASMVARSKGSTPADGALCDPESPCVIVESPYAGDLERNKAYAKSAMADCLERGESPFLSHLLYTLVLDDTDPDQRRRGLDAAQRWYARADYVVSYEDFGISPGMREGIRYALELGKRVVKRELGGGFGPI